MWLVECLKAPVSEHPLEVNVLEGPKDCWTVHDSTFMLTFRSCQTKSDVYQASKSDLKLEDRILTRWCPVTCILVMIKRTSYNKFQCNYLQKQKHFLELLLNFWNVHKIMEILKTKMILITLIFLELLIPKNVVTWMPESSCFRTPFGNKRVKGSQTLLKSALEHFYGNFSFMSQKVRCVWCPLVGSKMWGASFNTLTADHLYSCHNREKFSQQVPTRLSSKLKTFPGTFIEFLEST